MSEITGPPFCASPVWFRPITCLPSSRAAFDIAAATVTPPDPPMPMMWTPKPNFASTLNTGFGKGLSSTGMRPFFLLGLPPSADAGLGVTVTNDGQKPSTHE